MIDNSSCGMHNDLKGMKVNYATLESHLFNFVSRICEMLTVTRRNRNAKKSPRPDAEKFDVAETCGHRIVFR
jgi:hypothetical protein